MKAATTKATNKATAAQAKADAKAAAAAAPRPKAPRPPSKPKAPKPAVCTSKDPKHAVHWLVSNLVLMCVQP